MFIALVWYVNNEKCIFFGHPLSCNIVQVILETISGKKAYDSKRGATRLVSELQTSENSGLIHYSSVLHCRLI